MVDKTEMSESPADKTNEAALDSAAPSGETAASPAEGEKSAVAEAPSDKKPEEKTGLDIVREVLSSHPDTAKSPGAEPEKSEAAPAETGDTAKDDDKSDKSDDTDDDGKALPFHKHPAWQKQIAKRRDAETKAASLEKQLADTKPLHEFGQGVVSFMQTNGLTGENVSELLQLGAMIRTDPAKGREMVVNVLAALDNMLGETLPADLQARVDDGDISLDDAKALSKAKAAAALESQRAKDADDARKATETAQAETQRRTAVETAVNVKLAALRKADPDFAVKEELLNREVKARMLERGGKPFTDPIEAVKMLTEAHAHVGKILTAALPKPEKIDPARSKGGTSDSTAPPPNATGLEVTRWALERAAAG